MWGLLGFALKAFSFVKGLFFKSKEYRLGREEEINRQHQEAIDAQERMDQVDPSSERDVVDRLRRGGF